LERSCTRLKPGRTWRPRTPHSWPTDSQAKMITRFSTEESRLRVSMPEGRDQHPLSFVSAQYEIGFGAGQGTTPAGALPGTLEVAVPRRRLLAKPLQGRERVVSCLWSARPVFAGQDVRAMPCSAGPGGAIMVRRMNAVMPTATAPTRAKITCQVSDGMVSFTMPKVAW
jgi:hypothetical protein